MRPRGNDKGGRLIPKAWWLVGISLAALLAGLAAWLSVSGGEAVRFLLRLYEDPAFLREALHRWGILAPVIFIAIQALQVVVSPIPGDVTGFLGGYAFGQWLGFVYSTIGLTAGSLLAFWLGRVLGAPFVRRLLSDAAWTRLGFVVETGGIIVCLIIFLLPGVPKDIACYLFGMSPMSFWVFAIISTLGRMPGTWVLSAQGAKTAEGEYLQLVILSAAAVAVALPLYYYRQRIIGTLRRQAAAQRVQDEG